MKNVLQACLEDKDILELMRILMDEDSEGTLLFMQEHFKGKTRTLLEGN